MNSGYLLLVEDNPGDARLTAVLLEDAHTVGLPPLRWVQTIPDALSVLGTESGCVAVLLDLGLPDCEGLDALHTLAETEQQVPIIILSGNSCDTTSLNAITHGAQDFLIKGSFDANSLRRAIHFATERKRAEVAIIERALRDELTGLPRRTLLLDRLKIALRQAQRNKTAGAVLFVDLDGFKAVNDTFGHAAGDAVLLGVSANMKSVMRASDTIARMGGDEFVALLMSVAGAEDARVVADKLLASIEKPIPYNGTILQVSASIGMVLFNGEQLDAAELLQRADKAMYKAKTEGKGRVVEMCLAV